MTDPIRPAHYPSRADFARDLRERCWPPKTGRTRPHNDEAKETEIGMALRGYADAVVRAIAADLDQLANGQQETTARGAIRLVAQRIVSHPLLDRDDS